MEVAPWTVGRAETIGSWRSALPRDGGRRARPLDPTPPSGLDGLFPRVASNLVQANSRSPFRGRSYLPTRTTAHDKAPESRGAAAFRTRARVAAPARARATAGETDARAFFGPNRLMLWASQKLSPAAGVRPQGSRASRPGESDATLPPPDCTSKPQRTGRSQQAEDSAPPVRRLQQVRLIGLIGESLRTEQPRALHQQMRRRRRACAAPSSADVGRRPSRGDAALRAALGTPPLDCRLTRPGLRHARPSPTVLRRS
jgi:hypothetical protein